MSSIDQLNPSFRNHNLAAIAQTKYAIPSPTSTEEAPKQLSAVASTLRIRQEFGIFSR